MSDKLMLPKHLGGYEVTPTYPIEGDEIITGWVDEYGSITDESGKRWGDLVSLDGCEVAIIIVGGKERER